MKFIVTRSETQGTVRIPGSKSHTIRALFFAALATGKSTIRHPLISKDAQSAVKAIRAFGVNVTEKKDALIVTGRKHQLSSPKEIIDVGNSGTTLRIALAIASLVKGSTKFTGDKQIQTRPMGGLLDSLRELGAGVESKNNSGKVPITITGKARGGVTSIEAVTSQYLTALLMASPLYESDTSINVTLLNERPYIDITLWWLDLLNIEYTNKNYKQFIIPSNQSYSSFDKIIPGDFSSASFFLALAAINRSTITLQNLDMSDPQGDKLVISVLQKMGAKVSIDEQNKSVTITGHALHGIDIDMNSIPDALPILSVVACFASGTTKLHNVAQARLKETDRIRVMNEELTKMGGDVTEIADGLIIRSHDLHGTDVDGHSDHRIIMALSIAGLNCSGTTTIDRAEAVDITFPEFAGLIQECGGKLDIV